MNYQILDKKRIELLNELKKLPFLSNFYLAGGTGLSLIYRYRESYDFDFFTFDNFNPDELLAILIKELSNYKIEVTLNKKNYSTLDLYINEVQVSFFEYKYPLVDKLVNNEGLFIASIKDIACMKAIAINQRGSKKDFFDLYQIIKELNLSEKEFIDLIYKKFNDKNFISSLMFSFCYFDDAEQEILPKTYVDYSWDEIKKFFIKYSLNIQKII